MFENVDISLPWFYSPQRKYFTNEINVSENIKAVNHV